MSSRSRASGRPCIEPPEAPRGVVHAACLGAACALLCTLAAWTSLAKADPFHHQATPLGERALGMGGAFAGLANDPSATFYNPAGLARLDDVAISASLTLNAFDRLRIKDGFRTNEGSVDLEHTTRPALPLFAAFVKQVGWREGDPRRHAVAFSTLTVDRRRLGFDASIEGGTEAQRQVDTLSVADERSERWYGVSYAYRASNKLSFGLSSFLSINTWSHAEERVDLTLGDPNPADGTYQESVVVLRSRRATSDVKNGVFRLGVLYAFSGRMRVGAMFQPPSFRFRGRGTVRDRVVSSVAIPSQQGADYYQGSENGLVAHDPEPWELRLGLSWAPHYKLLFSLDVSAYGRRGKPDDPVVALGPAEVTPGTTRTPQPGDFVFETWWGRYTGNAAAGVEYRIRDIVILRAGLFSDLSAAPEVPKVSRTYRPSDVNRLGATLSLGLLARGYDVSLGVASTVGWGKTQAFSPDDPTGPYHRTNMHEETFFVFLSGARNAAGRLAQDTYEVIREKVQSNDENDDDD